MNIPIKVNIKKPYQLGVVGTQSSGGTGEIPDKSIGTEKLKDKSVTPEKLDREYMERIVFLEYVQAANNLFDNLERYKINNPIPTPTTDDVGKVLQLKSSGGEGAIWSAEFVEGVGGVVADGSVTTDKLADGSVESTKIVDNSITETKILNGSVTSEKLADKYATLVNMGIEDIEIPENVETDVYVDVINDEFWFKGVSIPWITEVSSIDEWLSSVKVFKYNNGEEYVIDNEIGDLVTYQFGNKSVAIVSWAWSHIMFLVDESDIGVTHNIIDENGDSFIDVSFSKSGFYSQNNNPDEYGVDRCIKVEFNSELKIDEKYLPDDLLNLSDKYATKEELEGVYTVLDSLVETYGQKFSGIIGGVTEFDLTEKDFANVTATRRYAFYQNTALKNVILPETLKEVGVNTFRGCTGLLTVIMKGLTTLQAGAFYDCTALTDFYLPDVTSADEVPTLNATAFTNTTCNFNVSSEEVKEFYLTDSIWNTFADRFQIKAISQ